jgi:hypothetical protein
MKAETLAHKIATKGQTVVTMHDDAYLVRGTDIQACIYDDLGSLIVHDGDHTDNLEYDQVLCEMMQIVECMHTGI